MIRTIATFVIACCAAGAFAQSYPTRTLRLIVPFPPGGATDSIGRVLANGLGERLGQQVVVENRPGGGGIIGAEAGARAAPDGYTLLLGSAESYGMTHAIAKRLAYNPDRDLQPLVMVSRAGNMFIVHPSVQANTLMELAQLARANPGKFRYGTPGIGSNPHLIGELFNRRFDAAMTHVPYKGGGNAITDLVSGQIEVLITAPPSAVPRAKAGQARALAITGSIRTPLLPDVPTMAEAGANDFVLGALFGVMAPSGIPAEAAARVTRDVLATIATADFKKRLVDIGQEPVEPLTGEAFAKYIRAEAARWRELAAAAGVRDE